MLSFDIETQGLDASEHEVTCMCAYDPDAGIDVSVLPATGGDPCAFFDELDRAPVLCAFNGGNFDIPFLMKRFPHEVTAKRAGAWMLKLVDLHEFCLQSMGVRIKLDSLLAANGVPVKTGTGVEAIRLAQGEMWEELRDYCRNDVVKTWQLYNRPAVLVHYNGWRPMHAALVTGKGWRWINDN